MAKTIAGWGVLLTFFGLSHASWAELDFTQLKGTHSIFDKNYEYLSPAYGFTYLRQGLLENLFRYGNKSREKNRIFEGEDPTTSLIRELFHIPAGDEGNLLPTGLKIKPAYYFKSSTIGKIFNTLVVQKGGLEGLKEKLNSEAGEKELRADLIAVIENDTHLYSNARAARNIYTKKLKEAKKALSECKGEEETAVLNQNLEEISQVLGLIDALGKDGSKGQAAKELPKWVDLLLASLKEALLDPNYPYPNILPLQVLSGYFWLQAKDDRHELLDLFREMKGAIVPGLFDGGLSEKTFLADKFTAADYKKFKADLEAYKKSDKILNNPEKAYFLAAGNQVYERSLPPVTMQSWAGYHPEKSATEIRKIMKENEISKCEEAKKFIPGLICYPDCFEATHRNLTRIMLEESGSRKMNLDPLEKKAEKKGHRLSDAFVSYVKNYPSNEEPHDLESRYAWSDLNCAIPGGKYNPNHEPCDLFPTFDNLERFYHHHFFSVDSKGKYAAQKTNVDKLDYLCSFLSSKNKELTWDLKTLKGEPLDREKLNEMNTDFTLEFKINGIESLKFEIKSNHAIPTLIAKDGGGISRETVEMFAERQNRAESHDSLASRAGTASSFASQIQSWGAPIWKTEHAKKVALTGLLSRGSLLDPFNKFSLMSYILSNREKKLYPAVLAMKADLTTDEHNERKFIELNAEHGFPIQEVKVPFQEKFQSVYSEISESQLNDKLGPEVAKKMGKSFAREILGNRLIIGEPLLDKTGKMRRVEVEAAIKACLKLNPEKNRAAVSEVFLARQEKLRAIGDSSQTPTEKLEKVYRKMRIPGCYLMSSDEAKLLTDIPSLGLPQITQGLWTSTPSGRSENAPADTYFALNHGQIRKDETYHDNPVRCACNDLN
jgi:hypothetical protein